MELPYRRQFLHLGAGAAALPAVSRVAWAQAYPTRPVRIIVGFGAGFSPDIVVRLVGQRLSERFGQQFVVENRPGAAGNLATEAVVRAPPDGYTLLLANGANAVSATLYEKLGFDFIRDIAPVASIAGAAYDRWFLLLFEVHRSCQPDRGTHRGANIIVGNVGRPSVSADKSANLQGCCSDTAGTVQIDDDVVKLRQHRRHVCSELFVVAFFDLAGDGEHAASLLLGGLARAWIVAKLSSVCVGRCACQSKRSDASEKKFAHVKTSVVLVCISAKNSLLTGLLTCRFRRLFNGKTFSSFGSQVEDEAKRSPLQHGLVFSSDT
jgi:hypothetical protein